MKFKNKFVLVTGASTGIGRAIAIEFGREGATVGLVARRITELEKTKEIVVDRVSYITKGIGLSKSPG